MYYCEYGAYAIKVNTTTPVNLYGGIIINNMRACDAPITGIVTISASPYIMITESKRTAER
ncbi:MAG: hypothetical protein ACI4J5_06465 [Oscillospiraceae bacterium]